VKLGSRAVGYLKSDLEAWLQSLKAPEPDSEPRP
jgi:predicted DNA-binding transcriptional regulator AlpA